MKILVKFLKFLGFQSYLGSSYPERAEPREWIIRSEEDWKKFWKDVEDDV